MEIQELIDEYAQLLSEIDAEFRAQAIGFSCKQCGACCTTAGNAACVATAIETLYLLSAFDKLSDNSKTKIFLRAKSGQRSCAFLDNGRCTLYYARPLCCRITRCDATELPFWISKFYRRIAKLEVSLWVDKPASLEFGYELKLIDINDFVRRIGKTNGFPFLVS